MSDYKSDRISDSEDEKMLKFSKNHSIPPISDDHLWLWLQNAPTPSTISMEDDHHLSDFIQISSSLPSSEKLNSGELSSLEDVILQGFDNAQFRNKQSNNVQKRKISSHGGNEGLVGGGEECKRQKTPRSTEVHNMKERLRRKKLAEKMAALQEMVPYSVKRDQASTIDDAIKYIQTLQCLVQMMSANVGHTLFNAPVAMQQGIQIPTLAPILQTRADGNGMSLGMLSSVGYPVGLPNPWLLQSSATSLGLPPTHLFQNNPGHFLEPVSANSIPCFGSQSSTATKGWPIYLQGDNTACADEIKYNKF